MKFSLFFFSAKWVEPHGDCYRMLRESAVYADRNGFESVWTPERHFSKFGGLYPSPSVTSAALATITTNIGLRAGSVVLPLQNPLRVAEEWAMIDNLSGGRVGVSFASGWHINDFVLSPQAYEHRRELMYEGIETVQQLWQGRSIGLPNGQGREVSVAIYPRPAQSRIPIWITAQTDATFAKAGGFGANLLTNMNYQSMEMLRAKIGEYRAAYASSGATGRGHVTLMVHTYIGDVSAIETKAKPAYAEYLLTNLDLQSERAKGLGLTVEASEEDKQFLISRAVDRMIGRVGLIGPPEHCLEQVGHFREAGVDEIACLVDFGVDFDSVMSSLDCVEWLKRRFQ
ncbi:LLM class flavin-dependent oxidoreductase [Bradyrhizobium sp. BR 10261]|nr:LLM class flavin-dependent oxidoreductase [Bradyrhizobium sp. BR 10261]